MIVLAIDPGPTQSGWVHYDQFDGLLSFGIDKNGWIESSLLHDKQWAVVDRVVIEMVASYGMPVGRDVFETCVQVGRFERCAELGGVEYERMFRAAVKLNLCNSARAKDSNIRMALIDRFGGKGRAIGVKKDQGPLYGVKSHIWAALSRSHTLMRIREHSSGLDTASAAHART